jgi:acylphosphatase
MTPAARRWTFFGRVQGVGFRATVASIAKDYQIIGYVENLSDGSVRVEVSGPENQVEAFLGAIKSRFSTYIREITVADSIIPRAQQAGFEIRY